MLNVTWKGKTFVGALFDSNKKDWAPPRYAHTLYRSISVGFLSQARGLRFRFVEPIKKPSLTENAGLLSNIDPSVRILRNGKKRNVDKLNSNQRARVKREKKTGNARYYRTNSCSSSELSTLSDPKPANNNNSSSSSSNNGIDIKISPTSPASSISSQYSNSRSS